MGAMNNENNPQVQVIDLASIAADGDVYGVFVPKKAKLMAVKLLNGASIAQSDTNFAVISLKVGSTTLAAHSTALTGGTGALTANVLADVPVLVSDLDAGALLRITYDETGTYAMTNAKVFIQYFNL